MPYQLNEIVLTDVWQAEAQHVREATIAESGHQHRRALRYAVQAVGVVPVSNATVAAGFQPEPYRQHNEVEGSLLAAGEVEQQPAVSRTGHRRYSCLQPKAKTPLCSSDALPLGTDLHCDVAGRAGAPIEDWQCRARLKRARQRPVVDTRVEPAVRAAILKPQWARGGVKQSYLRSGLLKCESCGRQSSEAGAYDGD
jgi:hypothetical protein